MECSDKLDSYAASYFAATRDEAASAARILRQLFPDGPQHVTCGARIEGKRALLTWWRGERTHCKACGGRFMPSTGTLLQESKLSYWQYETLLVLTDLGCDPRRIAGIIGTGTDTVRSWQLRLQVLQGGR